MYVKIGKYEINFRNTLSSLKPFKDRKNSCEVILIFFLKWYIYDDFFFFILSGNISMRVSETAIC